MNFNTTKKKGI